LRNSDELAAAVAVFDEGMELAGEQIDLANRLSVPWRL
jgi:hypothetical protein